MWWDYQNLNIPRKVKDGVLWHFRVWHDHIEGVYTQRIFFWDNDYKLTGYLEFAGNQTLHVSKIKQRMNKIISNPDYRQKFLCELNFPLEKNNS